MELTTGIKAVFLLMSALLVGPALGKVSSRSSLTPFAVCTAATEIICSTDCTQVMVCLGDGSGGLMPSPVATCGDGTICDADQAACVAPENSKCEPPIDDQDFTCHAVGAFPDPYDCQRYHICLAVNDFSEPGKCTGSTAYNPLRADCSLTTSDRVCTEGPIPSCEHLGQVGIVPENPSIYYICTQKGDDVVPEMYKCPGSQIFDTDVATCVESSVAPTPTPSTQSPPVTPSEGGKCSTPPEVVADPEDCHGYYHCVDEIWHHGHCIDGLYYDPQEAKCVSGSCPARTEFRKYF